MTGKRPAARGLDNAAGSRTRRALLTFRLDAELRQRLRERLASEGTTLSEVVVAGLRSYVGGTPSAADPANADSTGPAARLSRLADVALPEHLTARLRELRAAGRSDTLSAALAALHQSGWPLAPLARALGVSKQAIQARIRRCPQASALEQARSRLWHPPPAFPRRRSPRADGRRAHFTIKIDQALRAAAHRAAAGEGSSLSEVVERILHRYLRHGTGPREPGA